MSDTRSATNTGAVANQGEFHAKVGQSQPLETSGV